MRGGRDAFDGRGKTVKSTRCKLLLAGWLRARERKKAHVRDFRVDKCTRFSPTYFFALSVAFKTEFQDRAVVFLSSLFIFSLQLASAMLRAAEEKPRVSALAATTKLAPAPRPLFSDSRSFFLSLSPPPEEFSRNEALACERDLILRRRRRRREKEAICQSGGKFDAEGRYVEERKIAGKDLGV